jgi:transcriptional regulator with XRE-family HTH domain
MTTVPLETRIVLRCKHCALVQFQTVSRRCRRCRRPLFEDPAAPVVPNIVEKIAAERRQRPVARWLKELRTTRHLSQRKLAELMRVPRTYISKIEASHATPTLRLLSSMANALQVSIAELVCEDEDQVMNELSLVVRSLNRAQRAEILHIVQQLALMRAGASYTGRASSLPTVVAKIRS